MSLWFRKWLLNVSLFLSFFVLCEEHSRAVIGKQGTLRFSAKKWTHLHKVSYVFRLIESDYLTERRGQGRRGREHQCRQNSQVKECGSTKQHLQKSKKIKVAAGYAANLKGRQDMIY